MRAAVIFGLDSSEKDLKPFREKSKNDWMIGLPARSTEADAILIFGGDGTVHRHLPRLVQLQLPVLIVPCGSGNDFARALNLGTRKNSLAAWRDFSSGKENVRRIDLGTITPLSPEIPAGDASAPHKHYFCGVGGVGLDGEVTRRANQLPRWLRGHGGYVLSLPSALFAFAPAVMKLSVASSDNSNAPVSRRESSMVLVAFANTPMFGGGMKIAPRAKLDDGLLDVCIIGDINKFKLASLFPTVYLGKHLRLKEVEYLQTRRVQIVTGRSCDVYADGEYVCKTPVEVGVAPEALTVILPERRVGA